MEELGTSEETPRGWEGGVCSGGVQQTDSLAEQLPLRVSCLEKWAITPYTIWRASGRTPTRLLPIILA